MTGADVYLVQIVDTVAQYERCGSRLADAVRDNMPVEDRAGLYEDLIELADALAGLLHDHGDDYRQRAQSWRDGLDRLRRYQ
ncbi:hypothetical protein [Amycolatopsis sp. NPDC004378]